MFFADITCNLWCEVSKISELFLKVWNWDIFLFSLMVLDHDKASICIYTIWANSLACFATQCVWESIPLLFPLSVSIIFSHLFLNIFLRNFLWLTTELQNIGNSTPAFCSFCSRNYRFCSDENFCKAKVNARGVLSEKFVGFSHMSVSLNLLCFGCFAAR